MAAATNHDWEAILRRPTRFADGPAADRWFARIASILLNRTVFQVAGIPHRLIDVEVYYHGPGHEDPFAHRHPAQLTFGRWYFHRIGSSYRGGTFKGLDLAFGGLAGTTGTAYAGILFRGVEAPDGHRTIGPCRLVHHVLQLTGYDRVADLDAAIGERLVWDLSSPMHIRPARLTVRPIRRTARIGLTLKPHRMKPADVAPLFLHRPYRFVLS
jgi:hypothetical protein